MIQRIQSIYLFVAAVAMALFYFFPIADFLNEMEGYYKFYITHIEYLTPDTEGLFCSYFTLPLAILSGIIGLLCLFTIFKFNNRMLQLRLMSIAMFLTMVLLLATLFYYVPEIQDRTSSTVNYLSYAGIYFPLGAFVLMVLAYRAIRNDEKKVRSLDRLR